jgi:hypothetical protein
MFRILVDTSVWLDLAGDPRQAPLLGVLEELLKQGAVELIVPQIVVDEFQRNRDRVAARSVQGLAGYFKSVREAAKKIAGDVTNLDPFLSQLDDLAHKVPQIGGYAVDALERIEKLLCAAPAIEASDAVQVRAVRRAIEKKAPFQRDKNSIADAILMEIYGEVVSAKSQRGTRYAFVTQNTADFSVANGNHKEPHSDFASYFSPIKSLYFLNLGEALQRAAPALVTDLMIEQAWSFEPRELSEILEAEDILMHQVWYNRHKVREEKIESGQITIIEQAPERYLPNLILKTVWEGALESAKTVEKAYGKHHLGPWDDFEWGMINGKLSALRWVMGYDWDMLDT